MKAAGHWTPHPETQADEDERQRILADQVVAEDTGFLGSIRRIFA